MDTIPEDTVDVDNICLDTFATSSERSLQDIVLCIAEAESHGFYQPATMSHRNNESVTSEFYDEPLVSRANHEDVTLAEMALVDIFNRRDQYIQDRLNIAKQSQHAQIQQLPFSDSNQLVNPYITTLQME